MLVLRAGGGMFGQDDNQNGGQDNHVLLGAQVGPGGPAPGAPAGPVDHPLTIAPPVPVTDNQFNAAPVVNAGQPDGKAAELLDIKQEALHALTPLVSHLEQSAEEKFKTTMMMIQASDDQSLIREAYDAAQKIDDEKTRAQALLDIINEINYFTQNHHS